MHRPRVLALAPVAAFGLLAVASALAAQIQEESEELILTLTLPEVLERYYNAIGGLEDWDEVETKKLTGSMEIAPGAEATFVWYRKRPDKMRLEFVVQGQTGIQVFDGERGWELLPFEGDTEARPMSAEMLEELEFTADFDGPLAHWQEKDYVVELVSYEESGGLRYYKIKAMPEEPLPGEEGREFYFFIDAADWRLDRIEGKTRWEDADAEFEIVLSEYEEVGKGGLMEPLSVRQSIKGKPGGPEMTIESVELDVEMPDSLFAKPAGGVAAPPPPAASAEEPPGEEEE